MTISRRQFIRATATATAAMSVLGYHRSTRATENNSDVRMAIIGVGGRGGAHISAFKDSIVALCDADSKRLASRAQQLGSVDTYADYRKLLERKDIDAVSIATPNHQHSSIAIAAISAGKDVYCEKPVSHNVWEGRQLVHATRRYNRIVQCGTQSRSSTGIKKAVAFVREGKLGKIRYAVGTCYKRRASIGKLETPLEIPSHVDYDLWCGPAEKLPLYRPRFHYDWHWNFNTGNGDMGNQGIHQMDIARWFLGESDLSPRVMSIGGRVGYEDAGETPNTQTVLHDYDKAPLIFETRGLEKDINYRGGKVSVVIQCEEGHVAVPSYSSAIAYDNDGNMIKKWSGTEDHFQNFLVAVRSRNLLDLNAEIFEGHISSALCHTANISHRLGKKASARDIEAEVRDKPQFADSFQRMAAHLDANGVDIDKSILTSGRLLEMDPKTERFANSEKANRLLTREYREPFVVPDLSA